jgi:hypothetical protein
MTLWMGGQPVGRPLPTQDSTTQENGDTLFERLKTARASDRAAIGTG